VAGEIAVLPLAFSAWHVALIFSLLNALLLRRRIRVEETALAARRGHSPLGGPQNTTQVQKSTLTFSNR
jgi:hypothetical protein